MKPDNEVTPSNAPTAASEPRLIVDKIKDAESNPRAATDKLKALGEGMAKKHGG